MDVNEHAAEVAHMHVIQLELTRGVALAEYKVQKNEAATRGLLGASSTDIVDCIQAENSSREHSKQADKVQGLGQRPKSRLATIQLIESKVTKCLKSQTDSKCA